MSGKIKQLVQQMFFANKFTLMIEIVFSVYFYISNRFDWKTWFFLRMIKWNVHPKVKIEPSMKVSWNRLGQLGVSWYLIRLPVSCTVEGKHYNTLLIQQTMGVHSCTVYTPVHCSKPSAGSKYFVSCEPFTDRSLVCFF